MITTQEHEDINLHITKKQLGILTYLIVSYLIWIYMFRVISVNYTFININLNLLGFIMSIWIFVIAIHAFIMGYSKC